MPDQPFQHIGCPVVALRIEVAQLVGDVFAESLRDEMLAACKRVGARNVVVDLQPVTYVSSASFRPLLSLLRQARAHGGRLVLCNLQPDVREVFSVARLISTQGEPAAFEVQADVAAAVASLNLSATSGSTGSRLGNDQS
jgi:anti-anti-sigma factor